ncbi:BLUF domain-containing protein [Methylotenera sp. L2L1]|uniref:BLUF domain-containing protein n=1 Tax=Methylotenera sp. L2L1 TaxID=1502770 RepID=UPI00056635D0|nr:BLUF domain-containing protein [Methylotenera sp. L2L1]
MNKLLQIIYISRSTFNSTDSTNRIEPNVARILAKSRINNRKNGLVGVLYFGDGVFFQCLEGDEEAINVLMDKLAADSRHQDLKVISRKYINQLSFADWAMKFAPIDAKITRFIKENGFDRFNPYLFSDVIVSKFLNELFDANDPSTSLGESLLPNGGEGVAVQYYDKGRANLALICSALALVISVLSFLATKNLI